MKNIVIATPLFPPEIAEPAIYIKKISELLSKKHNITIVAFSDSTKKNVDMKIVTVSKNKPFFKRFFNYTRVLYKESKNADIIYVQNSIASGLPSIIVGLLLNIPVVLRFIGDEAWESATRLNLTTKKHDEFLSLPINKLKIRILILIQSFVLKKSKIIIFSSTYNSTIISDAYNIKKNKLYINYIIPEKEYILPIVIKPMEYQIITVSKSIKLKQIYNIIKAINILKNKLPKIKLIVVGKVEEKENIEKLISKLELSKNITFVGEISNTEIWHLQKTSSIRIFNSIDEYTVDSIINSMTTGILQMTINTPEIKDIIQNEKTGIIFKPNNPKNLADSIQKILQNNLLYKKIKTNTEILISKKFSLNSNVKKLITIFESLDRKS